MTFTIVHESAVAERGSWICSRSEMARHRSGMRAACMLIEADVPSGYRQFDDRDGGLPGIPSYKLLYNDALLITPREIEAALTAYEATRGTQERAVLALDRAIPNEDPAGWYLGRYGLQSEAGRTEDADLWHDWVRFLRDARACGVRVW